MKHILMMSSNEYGDEEFKYDTKKEMLEGLSRLITGYGKLNDGVERWFKFDRRED